MLIFISGGVRSGKSSFAEKLVRKLAIHRKIYIATSIVYDDEMKERVLHHQQSRADDNYITIEKPYNIDEISELLQQDDVVLVDCLTNLVANEMFSLKQSDKIIVSKIIGHINMICSLVKDVIIVSNDLFCDQQNYSVETLSYMKLLGKIHVSLVEQSTLAYEMSYGIPMKRKEVIYEK